jgi:hypothetical protein
MNCDFSESKYIINGKDMIQHRYRLFLSPYIFNPSALYNDDDTYIYMGIQFSNNELDSITREDFKTDYIKQCIILACNYYNIIYEQFTCIYDADQIFDIKPFYLEKFIRKKDNIKFILLGDGMSQVNFFSGSGLNLGINTVNIIIDNDNCNAINLPDSDDRLMLITEQVVKLKLKELQYDADTILRRSIIVCKFNKYNIIY